jgi:indolepyruvate ferredoxin oxidoreductase beta subunit
MLADVDTVKAMPVKEETALAAFPATVKELAALGFARLCDYQHRSYALQYVQRLQQVLDVEISVDPLHTHHYQATRETARWLALWMAFDDIVRVADLKSRASRRQRVALEVKQQDGELLRVYEHFKPGIPEFAALMPEWLATRLLRFDKARVLNGREPLSLPLKIGSHSVGGMLALRMLAGLKWLRPFGSRFTTEQHDIQHWLDTVCAGLREHHGLGLQLALCGRLIKGYGSTNERAKRNLQHILQHLAPASVNPSPPWRADAVRQAREAALTDEAGSALDQRLQALGAPQRAVLEQPIRFIRSAGRAKPE